MGAAGTSLVRFWVHKRSYTRVSLASLHPRRTPEKEQTEHAPPPPSASGVLLASLVFPTDRQQLNALSQTRLGGKATRTRGAASQPCSCDHGSHGQHGGCFRINLAICLNPSKYARPAARRDRTSPVHSSARVQAATCLSPAQPRKAGKSRIIAATALQQWLQLHSNFKVSHPKLIKNR